MDRDIVQNNLSIWFVPLIETKKLKRSSLKDVVWREMIETMIETEHNSQTVRVMTDLIRRDICKENQKLGD